jgi:hypothetical protein
MSARSLDFPNTEFVGRASSRSARRMFEDFQRDGLTLEESAAAMANLGFSQTDLLGMKSKKIKSSPEGESRDFPSAAAVSGSANEGAARRIHAAAHSPALIARIWRTADQHPWRTLGAVLAAITCLAALTAWKSARLAGRETFKLARWAYRSWCRG